MSKVNLEALIPREDLNIEEAVSGKIPEKADVGISDLRKTDHFFSALRKPDFQRVTSDWTPKKIYDFIKSFIERDTIPSLILWQNDNRKVFIIDGAHRISAIIAWINNDYGDGSISKSFFKNSFGEQITDNQKKVAQKIRQLITKDIGLYSDYDAEIDPDKALKLVGAGIKVQWITGSAKKAETSFLNINQLAAPINPTELKLIKARKFPEAIATRGIYKGGTGHKYWDSFEDSKQKSIEALSKQIHSGLFVPETKAKLEDTNLAIGGAGDAATTLPLILDFVNFTNKNEPDIFKFTDPKIDTKLKLNKEKTEELPEDVDGELTIKYLGKCKSLVETISGDQPKSLGLHPRVYLYSPGIRYRVAAFYALTAFIRHLESKNKIFDFNIVRGKIEQFLLDHDYFYDQIVRKYRGVPKSYPMLTKYLLFLMEQFQKGKTEKDIISTEMLTSIFNYLTVPTDLNSDSDSGAEFSTSAKNEAVFRKFLTAKCDLCGGYLDTKSYNFDHTIDVKFGGTGKTSNANPVHFYCNSVKDKMTTLGITSQ